MFDNAGLDSTELKKAKEVSNFLLGFTKYDPTTWESENVYAEYSHMAMQNDGSFDKMYQVAEQTDKEILDNIELAECLSIPIRTVCRCRTVYGTTFSAGSIPCGGSMKTLRTCLC